jgi:hypothetical protein
MRGALENNRPVDRLHQVVMAARNLEDDPGEASAEITVPSPEVTVPSLSNAIDKLEARWDNS